MLYDCINLTSVTIDSESIANSATSAEADGGLLANAKVVKILKTADSGENSYLNNNFIKIDVGAYNLYLRK